MTQYYGATDTTWLCEHSWRPFTWCLPEGWQGTNSALEMPDHTMSITPAWLLNRRREQPMPNQLRYLPDTGFLAAYPMHIYSLYRFSVVGSEYALPLAEHQAAHVKARMSDPYPEPVPVLWVGALPLFEDRTQAIAAARWATPRADVRELQFDNTASDNPSWGVMRFCDPPVGSDGSWHYMLPIADALNRKPLPYKFRDVPLKPQIFGISFITHIQTQE